MARTITLELDPVEAHLVLGAITAREVAEGALADKTHFADVAEHADVRAAVLSRVATRIADGLIPDQTPEHPAVARAKFERWATGS